MRRRLGGLESPALTSAQSDILAHALLSTLNEHTAIDITSGPSGIVEAAERGWCALNPETNKQ